MSGRFHETFDGGDVKPPSERSTGLTFTVVAVIVAVIWRNSPTVLWTALGMAAVFAVLALAAPRVLGPLNIAWFRFGLLLHKIVNPFVMFVLFVLLFIPAGLIMRLRYDPLRRKRAGPGESYWVERSASETQTGSMTNQF